MAQLYRRKGGDFLVNTETANSQTAPSVAALLDGGYVVVWSDSSLIGTDASGSGIKAQRFDSAGNKVGGEFLVNTIVAGAQNASQVAGLPSGRFVVTWTDASATGGDTSLTAIRGQLFEANGTPVGGEFLVNTQTAGQQHSSAITELAGGGFVVTWADLSMLGGDPSQYGIKAQLFDASAAKVGGEILVNTVTDLSQTAPTVTALPGGGFAVAWMGPTTFDGGYILGSIRLQLFDAAGAKVGAEQVVNATNYGNFTTPNIAALASGFVVTWAQQDGFNYSGPATFDVRSQMFDAAGAKLGAETIVHTGSAGSQMAPDVHALPGGGYLVTWQGPGQGLQGNDMFGQIFDAAGVRQGVTFVVSGETAGNQFTPEVEVLASGDIVIVWADSGLTGGDSSGSSVKGQILTISTAAPTDLALSATTISETAREGAPLATFATVGTLNSDHAYTIVSDSTGGAFGILGDKLVVVDNSLIDFETAVGPVQLRVRTTDDNGNSYEETIELQIADTPEADFAPAGDEFLVNTITENHQSDPVVTPLASGGFLVQWGEAPIVNGGAYASKGQLYDAAGRAVGGELTINGETAAALPGGGFVTTWLTFSNQTDLTDVRAQVYDSAGNPVGAEIAVNTTVAGYQFFPSIATFSSGGFVVSWADNPNPGSSKIRAQIFDSSGAKVGTEILVSPNMGWEAEVVVLESGNFVVAWSSGGAILAQIYSPTGFRFGTEFEVSSLDGTMVEPQVAALAGGGFVVAYARNVSSGGFTGMDNLSVQVFDANGAKVGDEVLISAIAPTRVDSLDVAALPSGGFVVSWTDQEDHDPNSFDAGIRTQVFDSTGQKMGPELAVNQIAQGDQYQVAVAVLASGKIVVGWTDASGQGGDSSGVGVKARIYSQGPTDWADLIHGTPGVDRLDGLGGDDAINGFGDADTLDGGAGNDWLDGGSGADTMIGGAGNDVHVVDDAGDSVIELAQEGIDEVRTGLASFDLNNLIHVENLTGISATGQILRGNVWNNVVTGGAGNDVIRMNDGGDDTVNAGAGMDNIFFIGSLTAADVINGGDGVDTLVVQGPYGSLTLTANITRIENVSILGGNNINFGEPGTNRYDYVLTVHDANFAAGVQARVNGSALLEGEDFTFNGSAETDAKFVVYGGKGVDTLTGGPGNDIFFYPEERFATGDTVNGGAGYDGMFLRGNYTIDFNAPGYTGLFTNIENLTLTSATDERYARGGGSEFDYNLTLSDAIVGAGQLLTVSGALLMATETMILDAGQETNGRLNLFGGKAADILKGGGGADLIHGNLGADTLAGNGGADNFRYQDIAESTAASMDQIIDFTPGTDKIELDRIDANSLVAGDQAFAWIGASAFSGVAGQLRAYPSSGTWFVEGDVNGDGVVDLVIALILQGPTPLGAGDFFL